MTIRLSINTIIIRLNLNSSRSCNFTVITGVIIDNPSIVPLISLLCCNYSYIFSSYFRSIVDSRNTTPTTDTSCFSFIGPIQCQIAIWMGKTL